MKTMKEQMQQWTKANGMSARAIKQKADIYNIHYVGGSLNLVTGAMNKL